MMAGFSSEEDVEEKWYSVNSGIRSLNNISSLVAECTQLETILEHMQGEPMVTNNKNLSCILGHISISELNSYLSVAFKAHQGVPSTNRMTGLFVKCLRQLGEQANADIVIYDLSPSIGPMNELALLSSDYFIIPCLPDYFSLQAISSLAAKVSQWKQEIADLGVRSFREAEDMAVCVWGGVDFVCEK